MFKRKKIVILFLLPGLLGLLLFYIVPFFGGIYYSVTDGSLHNRFVGFQNYIKVWNNTMFRQGLKNTFELSLICAPAIWLMSFIIAAMLRVLGNKSTFFRNVLLLPYLMPSAAIILIWRIIFDYSGVVNRLVVALGYSKINWLDGMAMRLPVILLYIWKNLGFSIVIFAAALQSVPEAYYEYASLEGANAFQREFKITLPLIMPTAFLVFVLAWINTFKIFKEVFYISGAYPSPDIYTLQHYMNNLFNKLEYQNVTTAAYIFAAMVFVIFAILFASKSVRSPDQI